MIVKGGGGSAVPTNATKLEYCLPSNDDSAGGLFITVCLFAGLLCKIFLTDYIPVPYTVVVLIVGGGLGTLAWIAEHETKVNRVTLAAAHVQRASGRTARRRARATAAPTRR